MPSSEFRDIFLNNCFLKQCEKLLFDFGSARVLMDRILTSRVRTFLSCILEKVHNNLFKGNLKNSNSEKSKKKKIQNTFW